MGPGRGSVRYRLGLPFSPVPARPDRLHQPLYVYELPTHHCPFCLLHREYNGIGYPFYLLLLTGTIAGLGIGLLHRYRAVPSLQTIIPAMQHRLALTALVADAAFLVLAMGSVVSSSLRL